MVIHSSILAWRISWTEKPGGLQSMGSQGVSLTFKSYYLINIFQMDLAAINSDSSDRCEKKVKVVTPSCLTLRPHGL